MNPVLSDFKKAVSRLKEVLDLKKNKVVRDSAIKRFEICFDLAWKAVKLYAKKQGIECYSPRQCFKTAFQLKLINNQEGWLKMIDDRNITVNICKEEYADKVYKHFKKHRELLEKLIERLS